MTSSRIAMSGAGGPSGLQSDGGGGGSRADDGIEKHRVNPDRLMPTCWSVVMPAPTPRATPVSEGDLVRLRVLEAYIETLRAENEMLKRRLAATEVWPARSVPRCGVGVVGTHPGAVPGLQSRTSSEQDTDCVLQGHQSDRAAFRHPVHFSRL